MLFPSTPLLCYRRPYFQLGTSPPSVAPSPREGDSNPGGAAVGSCEPRKQVAYKKKKHIWLPFLPLTKCRGLARKALKKRGSEAALR
jgi:hypothetical protein